MGVQQAQGLPLIDGYLDDLFSCHFYDNHRLYVYQNIAQNQCFINYCMLSSVTYVSVAKIKVKVNSLRLLKC